MLQAALDDVDWDMFRASSFDVSEFTDVAVSFVNTLTKQAVETITVRTFPNQKPWVDRTIQGSRFFIICHIHNHTGYNQ